MVYVILSDIHSNIQAFEAVVNSFPKDTDKSIISVGDIVGYGADPIPCIDLIKSIGAKGVVGNHDAASADKMDLENFTENARLGVIWTKQHIDEACRNYLMDLPYVLEIDAFTVVHGTLHRAEEFIYMYDAIDAIRTFEILKTQICFVGHTHVPCIFIYKDGKLYQSFEKRIVFEENAKYIVNVGSVGQPRDYNWRASFCIYDSTKGEIEFQRVDYDREYARERIIEAGLPRVLGDRLLNGR